MVLLSMFLATWSVSVRAISGVRWLFVLFIHLKNSTWPISGVRRSAQNDLSAPARCVQVGRRFRFPNSSQIHTRKRKIHTRNPVQGADWEVRRASSSELSGRSAHGDSQASNIFKFKFKFRWLSSGSPENTSASGSPAAVPSPASSSLRSSKTPSQLLTAG